MSQHMIKFQRNVLRFF